MNKILPFLALYLLATNSFAAENIHTVSEGETMSHLVKKYNISSEDIKKANDKKTDVVWVGMKLTIPVNGVNLADSQKVEQKQQAKPETEKSVENQSPIYPSSSRVYKKVQHGVEFKHQGSDEVKACLGGTVTAIVNTIENLKPLVILKHGKRTTIYGKLSSISVKQGDVVEQGAKIGTFGKEGLYFSAREDGEFVDPAEFLLS
jgi:murein DD-endopeptidase MepM/ murein hydrolase activator NlpD